MLQPPNSSCLSQETPPRLQFFLGEFAKAPRCPAEPQFHVQKLRAEQMWLGNWRSGVNPGSTVRQTHNFGNESGRGRREGWCQQRGPTSDTRCNSEFAPKKSKRQPGSLHCKHIITELNECAINRVFCFISFCYSLVNRVLLSPYFN